MKTATLTKDRSASVILLVFVLMVFVESWALMILLGIFASYGVGLAVGFWAAMGIRFLIRLAF